MILIRRRSSPPQGMGWQSMSTAPRDGTAIELCCTYGIAPWYGLFRWTDKQTAMGQDGKMVEFKSPSPGWWSADGRNSGVTDEEYLHWRPTKYSGADYVDPTGGQQWKPEYWRKACGL